MSNPFRINNQIKEGSPTRAYSKAQETAVAKELGGKCTANSGATTFSPGDVVIGNLLLIECKTKEKDAKSFAIKKEWLEKNLTESIARGTKYNALAFNYGPNQPNYYIIDERLFKEFVEYLKNNR